MNIIVDTNIIFSALLNSNSAIGVLLFQSDKYFQFYSSGYMRYEIQHHWKKLQKISNLSDKQLVISYGIILSKIQFTNEELIPKEIWLNAEKLTENIDCDDIDFVALTQFLNGFLWTGDKALYNGLRKMDFKQVINTTELQAIKASLQEF